jgi:hypothetical protein
MNFADLNAKKEMYICHFLGSDGHFIGMGMLFLVDTMGNSGIPEGNHLDTRKPCPGPDCNPF